MPEACKANKATSQGEGLWDFLVPSFQNLLSWPPENFCLPSQQFGHQAGFVLYQNEVQSALPHPQPNQLYPQKAFSVWVGERTAGEGKGRRQ